MQHFSSVDHVTFISYQVNAGEYGNTVNFSDVLQALARAMKVPYRQLIKQYWSIMLNDETLYIDEAEYDVLVRLLQFKKLVKNYESDYWKAKTDGTSSFSYYNLNDGSHVSWFHVVI